MRERRRLETAARASWLSPQMGVPTSTTLRCSSGLIWSPSCAPPASISSMWLFSSDVAGSTSPNSTWIPRASTSAIPASPSGRRLHDEGGHLPAARGDVGQRRAAQAREEPFHLALEDERVEVHDEVAEAQLGGQLRKALALEVDL